MKCLSGLLLLILPLFVAAEVVVPIESVENHVNIRMSPDSKSEIVGHLNQGDYLPLVASTEEWHEVAIAGGATGFISAEWTVVLAEPPSQVAETESDGSRDETDTASPDKAPAEASQTGDAQMEENASAGPETTAGAESGEVSAQTPGELAGPSAGTTADETETVEAAVEAETAVAAPGVAQELPEVEPDEVPAATEEVVEADEAVPADAEQVVEEAEETVSEPLAPVRDEEESEENIAADTDVDAAEAIAPSVGAGLMGPPGPPGPQGPPGPPGPAGNASIEGSVGFLTRFTAPTIGGSSQIYDNGNSVGIGTTEPKQRLEVNGNIQIHERNSSVAGLMITQSDGETGYIMHNRASTLTIGAGSVDRITIDRNGNVGFGVSRPANPIEMASGAHVTAGGVWTNSSSRTRKENISDLSLEDALAALTQLEPVQFNYKNDRSEKYVGFIAEDVPDLVATSDRDGLSSMDIVAVLTKVVQDQQKKIEELEARLDER